MSQRMDHIIDTYINVWNGASTDLLDDIVATDIQRDAGSFQKADGLEALKAQITDFRTAFPDTDLTIRERAYGDDFLFCIWTFNGTNTGPGEFPATGRSVNVSGSTLIRVRDGRMFEEDVHFDVLSYMNQLGFELQEPTTA